MATSSARASGETDHVRSTTLRLHDPICFNKVLYMNFSPESSILAYKSTNKKCISARRCNFCILLMPGALAHEAESGTQQPIAQRIGMRIEN